MELITKLNNNAKLADAFAENVRILENEYGCDITKVLTLEDMYDRGYVTESQILLSEGPVSAAAGRAAELDFVDDLKKRQATVKKEEPGKLNKDWFTKSGIKKGHVIFNNGQKLKIIEVGSKGVRVEGNDKAIPISLLVPSKHEGVFVFSK